MRTYVRSFFLHPLEDSYCTLAIIEYICATMRNLIVLLFILLLPLVAVAEGRGFNLIVVGDPQPQTEDQLSRLEQDIIPKIRYIVDEYKESGYPTAILLTGDVVWDTVEFLPRIKQTFESLGVEVYAVMGNHDHNRTVEHNEELAEREYVDTFGRKYYTFTLGDTSFITLDNILFNSYTDYSIGLDREQRRWLKKLMRDIPDNQRIAICMHAPACNFDTGKPLAYAKPLVRWSRAHNLHFITGHCHRHNTIDINPRAIEHSVAQVNGNLWFAPICADGTPQGVFCIEERNGEWRWHHRTLGTEKYSPIVTYCEGEVENYEDDIVVKVIGWDTKWQVEWAENGEIMGSMQQIDIVDPSYLRYVNEEADYDDIIMQRLRRSARPAHHYFRCRRTEANSHITITATDRFGRRFEVEM